MHFLFANKRATIFTQAVVSEVQKNNVTLVKFFYNDKGFRVRKLTYTNGEIAEAQYYIRDVAGSVISIVSQPSGITTIGNGPPLLLPAIVEYPIYGASRLGVYKKGGNTNYELTDHLGNVRAVVTKGSTTPSMFADYYPGGMQMPNRNSLNGSYRYGYQGQFAETDPETGKPAFQLRLYDTRINRWLTTDPYGQYFSPYLAMGNRPNMLVDPDGGCVDENGNPCAHGDAGSSTLDGGGNSWTWDGETWQTDFAFGLNEVTITGQTTDHARTMSNPLVQSIHQAQFDFMTHDATKAAAVVLALPFALESMTTLGINSLEEMLISGGGDFFGQTLANGGDLTKVDFADVVISTIFKGSTFTYGSQALINGSVEDKGIVFEKSLSAAVITAAGAKASGKIHGDMPLNSKSITKVQEVLFKTYANIGLGAATTGVGKLND